MYNIIFSLIISNYLFSSIFTYFINYKYSNIIKINEISFKFKNN